MTPENLIKTFDSALAGAANIQAVRYDAENAFVQMSMYLESLALALTCGLPLISLGPPGTGKSASTDFFAKALEMLYYYQLLNPDSKKESLFGPISPSGLRNDKFIRHPAGVRLSEFVFVDEIGKASGQVRDMLLEAMERRTFSESGLTERLPVHLFVSASNETLLEESEAVWDRFIIRHVVSSVEQTSHLIELLDAQKNIDDPVSRPLDREQQVNLRFACKHMAHNLSGPVKKTIAAMFAGFKKEGISGDYISNRRWARFPIVAGANALLNGRTEIEAEDLQVGKFVLWSEAEEANRQAIYDMVDTLSQKDAQEKAIAKKMLDDLEDDARNVGVSLESQTRLKLRAQTWLKERAPAKEFTGRDWDNMRVRGHKVLTMANDLIANNQEPTVEDKNFDGDPLGVLGDDSFEEMIRKAKKSGEYEIPFD